MCAARSIVARRALRYGSAVEPWLPTWKLKPREADSGGEHMLDQQFRVGRFGAEFRRQIRFDDGLRNASRTRIPMSAGSPVNFWASSGIVDDERADTGDVGVLDVGELLDGMGVDAPVHRDAQATRRGRLRRWWRRRSRTPPAADRVEDGRMGRGLDRVVQAERRAGVDMNNRHWPATFAGSRISSGVPCCGDRARASPGAARLGAACHAAATAATISSSTSSTICA